jgi:hypothetical protein
MEIKYYKDLSGNMYGYAADGSQDHLIPSSYIPITADEQAELFKQQQANLLNSLSYAKKRASEYPDFRDYLDGIVKGDTAQQEAYIAACLAVKTKYPKQ